MLSMIFICNAINDLSLKALLTTAACVAVLLVKTKSVFFNNTANNNFFLDCLYFHALTKRSRGVTNQAEKTFVLILRCQKCSKKKNDSNHDKSHNTALCQSLSLSFSLFLFLSLPLSFFFFFSLGGYDCHGSPCNINHCLVFALSSYRDC